MKTISDFLQIIRQDEDLKALILYFSNSWGDSQPKTQCRSKRTKAGILTEVFWHGIEGAKFRHLLENRYGVQLSIENRSKIKDALLLYFTPVWKE